MLTKLGLTCLHFCHWGLALLCCPCKVWSLLSWVLQLVASRSSSPTWHMHWWEQEGYLSTTRDSMWQMSNRDSSPMLTSSGLSHSYLHQRDCFYIAAHERYRVISPMYWSWWQEGIALLPFWPQGQLYHLPQELWVGRGGHLFPVHATT